MKRSRLDTTGACHQQSFACIEASYAVSLRIARARKPHTIGDDLILPCLKDMVRLVLGDQFAKKSTSIPLYCMIHRQSLACKTMLTQILTVKTLVIKIVNFIKSSAFKDDFSGNFAKI